MNEVFVSDMGVVTRRHTEEGERRRQIDAEDRSKIRKGIVECHHALETSALKIINISNGYVANEKVNVENAVFISNKMKTEFQNGLPEVFHKPVHVQVYIMESMKHGVKIGGKIVCDTEKLYGRLLVLSQKRDISLKYVFSHELAPLPSSLFDEYGFLRKSKRSNIASKMIVSYTGDEPVNLQIIDGNELLYHISWPKAGTITNLFDILIDNSKEQFPVHVVFVKYNDDSIKSYERERRTIGQAYPD